MRSMHMFCRVLVIHIRSPVKFRQKSGNVISASVSFCRVWNNNDQDGSLPSVDTILLYGELWEQTELYNAARWTGMCDRIYSPQRVRYPAMSPAVRSDCELYCTISSRCSNRVCCETLWAVIQSAAVSARQICVWLLYLVIQGDLKLFILIWSERRMQTSSWDVLKSGSPFVEVGTVRSDISVYLRLDED